jgi:GTP diphosphokinase / guanosine-3',5'-bis(diphosphate) 3'-diphosphatase
MDNLLSKIKSIHTVDEAVDLLYSFTPSIELTQKALSLSMQAHEGQYRKSGEPYIIHPILVASLIAHLSSDESMIIAALLHDIVEDTKITLEMVQDDFGADVALLVDGMTKIDEIRDQKLLPSDSSGALTKSALSFRKILLTSTKDVRVLVVKLCDRMHNMLTLDALPPEKQKRIAEETMVVYAPIAHRLGVSLLKRELEDLSFKYLFSHEYEHIDTYIKSHQHDFTEILNKFIKDVTTMMFQAGFLEDDFQLVGRVKHFYSTYLKLQRKGISIEEVLDLLAVRILVNDAIDAYKVVGIIHLNFKPLMSRFKDYISVPKENGYQTIHTTVFSDRSIIEVQVRTFDMHHTAELGVAAHWKYKTGGDSINLDWLSNLSGQGENVELFMDLAQKDLFSEDIVVYSPKGESFTLPRGSVALDYAYTVHTDIGDKAISASINKNKRTLLTELKNGDIVSIKLGEELGIRCTWIDAVKTSKARHALAHHCNIRNREIDLIVGVNVLSTALSIEKETMMAWLGESEYVNSFNKAAHDDSYVNQVMNSYINELQSSNRFSTFLSRKKFKLKTYLLGHLKIMSQHSVNETLFKHCCHPKKGDDIIAFKKGNVVEVHHKMCDTALAKIDYDVKMLIASWNDERVYKYQLTASLVNSQGALAKFLLFLAKMKVDILSIELGNKNVDAMQYCSLSFETKESDVLVLKQKIERETHIIELVCADDIYKN